MGTAQEARSLAQTLARIRAAQEIKEAISVRITSQQRQDLERLHAHLGGKRAELLRAAFEEGLNALALAAGLDLDAEQGESRVVGAIEGNLFGDWRYLDACEGGDLHTTVARLVWPRDLPWTGNTKSDRKLAEEPYYRHYDRTQRERSGLQGNL